MNKIITVLSVGCHQAITSSRTEPYFSGKFKSNDTNSSSITHKKHNSKSPTLSGANLERFRGFKSQGHHWPAKTFPLNRLPPNMAAINLH